MSTPFHDGTSPDQGEDPPPQPRPDPFRSFEADLRQRHVDPELLAAWEDAKGADFWDRLRLKEDIESGRWARRRRLRGPPGRRAPLGLQRPPPGVRTGEPDDASIGRWLRAERALAAMTQARLAGAARISRPRLSRLERGERPMTYAEACRLSDALGVGLEAFRPPRPPG